MQTDGPAPVSSTFEFMRTTSYENSIAQKQTDFSKSATLANSKISEFRFSNLCFGLTDQYGSFSLLLHLQGVLSVS